MIYAVEERTWPSLKPSSPYVVFQPPSGAFPAGMARSAQVDDVLNRYTG